MKQVSQFTADGYYVGPTTAYSGMPNNAHDIAVKVKPGFIPRLVNGKIVQVENHKGESGYVNGEPHTIKDYGPRPDGWSDTPPPPTPEELAAQARAQRDALISATDYLVMPDYPIVAGKLAAVQAYRQSLRDISKQPGFPDAIVWPDKPEV